MGMMEKNVEEHLLCIKYAFVELYDFYLKNWIVVGFNYSFHGFL